MIAVWNVVLGVGIMLWAFGHKQTRAVLSKSGRAQRSLRPQGRQVSTFVRLW